MRILIAAIVLAVTLGTPLAQGEAPVDETRTTLRQELLRLVNHDRVAHGLLPVELDIEASVIADEYCRKQLREKTNGHFTTDGRAPYMRYSFAGGNDGVSENTAAWSAPFSFNDRALLDMTRRSQQAMMEEKPPHDGHRRTILDPHATHVGIGLAWEKGEFRIAQEFVRRYVTWSRPLPRSASANDLVRGAGKPLSGAKIEAITVHHEPAPQPMPVHVANAISHYSLPTKRKDYLPLLKDAFRRRDDGTLHVVRNEYRDGRRGDFHVADDGSFSFGVPFTEGPGVYTVVVWVRKDGSETPVAASNVSINVRGETWSGTR
ncbi:MAG TPA: CAP domain-containing protein [Thermoanaerobaculia bacterium]